MVIFVTSLPIAPAYADNWREIFGGSGWDRGNSVQQTADGGFIIAGYTESFGAGAADIYLIKTDASGNEMWSKTIGGEDVDVGFSIQQTTDGGFIIAGFTMSFGAGAEDVYLVKTDAEGVEMWSKTFGNGGLDGSKSVQQTMDGGYILVGDTEIPGAGHYDVYLIKTDADGNELWSKTFGGTDHEVGYSVRQTTDGGYIIAGNTGSFGAGYSDVCLIRTDADGNELWSKTFGGAGWDRGFSVEQTTDGGYMVVGDTESLGAGMTDVYLIKTDANGNEMWSKTFGGSARDGGLSIWQTTDGGSIIVGATESFGAGAKDIYFIKTDALGNEMWSRTLGGELDEDGRSIQQISDGGYIIVGYTESFGAGNGDICLISISKEPVSLTLTPDAPLLTRGETLNILATAANNTDEYKTLLFYTTVSLPNGDIYPPSGYLVGPISITLTPYEIKSKNLLHDVPLHLPLGMYTYNGYLIDSAIGEGYNYHFNIEVIE
jgi:hypothetical protein